MRNRLENATLAHGGMLLQILLLVTPVLLRLFVLVELLEAFEGFAAGLTLVGDLAHRTGVCGDHLGLLELKHVFSDGWQLCDPSLGVVNVELSQQMQLVILHRLKLQKKTY